MRPYEPAALVRKARIRKNYRFDVQGRLDEDEAMQCVTCGFRSLLSVHRPPTVISDYRSWGRVTRITRRRVPTLFIPAVGRHTNRTLTSQHGPKRDEREPRQDSIFRDPSLPERRPWRDLHAPAK